MISYALKGRIVDVINNKIIENGLVITNKELIYYSGEFKESLIKDSHNVIQVDNGTIIPGFIDCHVHLTGHETSNHSNFHDDNLLASVKDISTILYAGFTTIRDMSGNGFALSKAVENNILKGPNIIPGGKVLSPTSGHVDFEPWERKEDYNLKNKNYRLCDGVDDCILAVREQFRQGAKFIKICATGGVSSRTDNLSDIQFSKEEISSMVEEAKRHGSYVTAHCTGDEGMKEAILAGVSCIEHGVMASQETINLMKERNIPLVSTLYISLNVANFPGLPREIAEKAKYCANANLNTIKMAKKAEIMIALGTDFSNSKNTSYADSGKEFEAMIAAGLTEFDAIKAGTINSAKLMNIDNLKGSLDKDKIADILIVKGNPTKDISCLSNSENIKIVIKNGIVEKNIL